MTVRVKICGLTNLEDALAAVELGADAVGFVFAPSPRQVTPETVREIVSELPPFVTKVGVFVDADPEQIRQTVSLCGLDLIQLHGSEGSDVCAGFYPRVIKTFDSNRLPSDEELGRFRVAALMVDREKGSALQPEEIWPIARMLGKHGRVILAGGLAPQNVARAIAAVRPYAVDVSSGVEERPGKKDRHKMEQFIQRAKTA